MRRSRPRQDLAKALQTYLMTCLWVCFTLRKACNQDDPPCLHSQVTEFKAMTQGCNLEVGSLESVRVRNCFVLVRRRRCRWSSRT